jgi:D-alanine-D-alanine ligase
VAVLGDRAIGAVEIAPRQARFYDYGAKYTSGASDYHIPPRVSPERYRGLLTQALRANRALGCAGATRVDMIVATSGNEYLLEVNTVPGLTPTSLLPKIAGSIGISFGELCEHPARRDPALTAPAAIAAPASAPSTATSAVPDRAPLMVNGASAVLGAPVLAVAALALAHLSPGPGWRCFIEADRRPVAVGGVKPISPAPCACATS